ncbi:MAG: isopenicillin N synthase family oxygenase [Anaerolineae bacterium]|nr:isopenicillin N synthase family oxygenase [Anaerolineae bacterium]
MSKPNLSALPTIDLSRLDADDNSRAAFLNELREAAHTIGFFYLTGHGIDTALTDEIRALARRFFNLPEQDKLAIEMVHSPHFRGYTRIGMERTRGLPDWREQIDIGAERPVRPRDDNAPWWRLQGPNQWPAALPELREVALRYQADRHRCHHRLVHAFAIALGQPETIFDGVFMPDPQQLLKVIRYPGRDLTDGDQGVGEHKDGGFVTLLLQDEQEGLQVQYQGEWISAPPIPGTFVVNIGELFELASNGYLRATVHRVLDASSGQRPAFGAVFFGAKLDGTIPVLSLPADLASGVRGLTQDPMNPMFREVGRNQLKSRLRSHPDVARRHHADLLPQFLPA